jgi:pheromone alpha factor receptor
MSDTDFFKYSPPQNPFNQPFTLLLPDGTPFNVTTGDLASFHYYTVKLAINRGVMIGACIIMLICLLVLTKRDKRGSPIFIINLLALLLTAIRQILVAIFLAGPFQHPYAVVAGDFDHITSIDKSNSIAVPVLATITLAIILISLLMQVKVVAATMQRTHRMALLGFCSVFALVAIGFQFALMVINCKAIIALESIYGAWFVRLQKETYASLVATLLLFTLIFVTKLGFAIRKRHQLGLRRFGPMQVIFIMGVQTLIVPSKVAPSSAVLCLLTFILSRHCIPPV